MLALQQKDLEYVSFPLNYKKCKMKVSLSAMGAVNKTSLKIEPETALHRCSYKKVFWKYAANSQENPMPKCNFKLKRI